MYVFIYEYLLPYNDLNNSLICTFYHSQSNLRLLLKSELVTLPFKWDALVSRRNILTTKLCNLQQKIWQAWLEDIDKIIAEGLDEHVLFQSGAGQQLQLNFARALFTLLKETKYLLALQAAGRVSSKLFPMPEALLSLYEQRDAYWHRRIRLIKIDEFYNGIRAGQCAAAELQLIAGELAAIDEQVATACAQLTWRNYGKWIKLMQTSLNINCCSPRRATHREHL